jgi:lipopolysaccharide export LptBFGC system permease protein LptF
MSSAATSPATASRPGRFHRFWRTVKQLLLEIVGAFFAVAGLAWLQLAFRSWTRDGAHWLTAATVGVALLFFFFALTSFRRARKL